MKRALPIALALTIAASACGGEPAARAPRTPIESPITTTAPPPLDGTKFEIGQEFWHSGYRVNLEAGEVFTTRTRFTNRTSYWVTLRGEFENLGADLEAFEPAMQIEFAGEALATMQGVPPAILPGESALGELTFLIPEDFDPWAAALSIGEPGVHRAKVPLAGNGDVNRLAPTILNLDGVASLDLVDLSFTSGMVAYDDPLTHTQMATGTRSLTVAFDVTSRLERTERLMPEDFQLVLPDGTSLEAAAYELGRIEGATDGSVTAERYLRFEIAEDLEGELEIRFAPREALLLEDGVAEAFFAFSI